ncbi:MAG TPA: hypothetical protein VEI02_15945 [Planctomycetota bacterium]|nr:hypothetical protein [Planctomycetota bacterium]
MRRSFMLLPFACVAACSTDGSPPPGRATSPSPAVAASTDLRIGDYRRPFVCADPVARRHADEGLAWIVAFNHDAAIRAFQEATTIEPGCAFAWWGIAFACGPNINNPQMDAARVRLAVDAARRAVEAAERTVEVERDLARAVAVRYVDPPPADRRALDIAFADAMRDVRRRHLDDPDVAVVFADALMNLRPWEYWKTDGAPQPETPEIVDVLQDVLAKRPRHPWAHHAWIHAVEASNDPGRAAASADFLRSHAADLGHLLHMPAHIDQRLGRYDAAIEANRRGIEADLRYVERVGRGGFYDFYRAHNYHFLIYAAMFDGRKALCLSTLEEMEREMPLALVRTMPEFTEAFLATRWHVLVRFGLFDEVLAAPAPAEDLFATRAHWRYARGVALAAKGRVAEAEAELAAFSDAAARVPATYFAGRNTSKDVVAVAGAVLKGETLFRRGDRDGAFAALREADRLERALKYDEPWGWMTPPAHALGALLLEAGDHAAAEETYRADLRRHPENGWALHGLAECLKARGAVQEAADAERRFAAAWARADVPLRASCFCRAGD